MDILYHTISHGNIMQVVLLPAPGKHLPKEAGHLRAHGLRAHGQRVSQVSRDPAALRNTIWLFNIAMENPPIFKNGKPSISWAIYTMAMLNNQRVSRNQILG